MNRNIQRLEGLCGVPKVKPSGRTVAVCEVDGEGPVIANHLSPTTYKIRHGIGELTLLRSEITTTFHIRKNSAFTITIPRREPYQYKGTFEAIVEWPLPPLPALISTNEQLQLPADARTTLDMIDLVALDKAQEQHKDKYDPDVVGAALVYVYNHPPESEATTLAAGLTGRTQD